MTAPEWHPHKPGDPMPSEAHKRVKNGGES